MSEIRHTESKAKIKKALLVLLKKKDFNKISITDITRSANINRGTFYLHYLDKFDLIEKIVEEVKVKLYSILIKENRASDEEALNEALIYIQSEYELFQTLENSSAAAIFDEAEYFLSELFLRDPYFKKELITNCKIPEDYLIKSFCSAVTAIVIQWINNNCKESPKEISKILTTIRNIYTSYSPNTSTILH